MQKQDILIPTQKCYVGVLRVVQVRLYERVSTERQATEGFSLEAQHERLVAYCVSQGWHIAGRYIDDGASAKSLDRAEFQRMLSECQSGEYILIYRLDRLTRSSRDIEFLLELAEKRNIFFKSATEDINTATSSGRFHLRLIVQFAQYERETIAERASMGKRHRALSGFWQGGKAPFGYRMVESNEMKAGRVLKRLEPHPLYAHLVPQIFARYLAGDGVRTITRWLNTEAQARTPRGALFSTHTVGGILKNPSYCGDATYDRMRKPHGYERVAADIPPLITRETFEEAALLMTRRKAQAPRTATGMFPLTGIAVCGNCGGKLYGVNAMNGQSTASGKRFRAYLCANYKTGRSCGDPPLVSVSADIVEANLIALLEGKLDDTEEFRRFFAQCIAEPSNTADNLRAEIERLQHELRERNLAVAQWDAKYEKQRISEEEHEEKTSDHRLHIRQIRERIAELQESVVAPVTEETARVAFENVRSSWEYLSHKERKVVIQTFAETLRVQVVVYRDRRVELRPKPSAAPR